MGCRDMVASGLPGKNFFTFPSRVCSNTCHSSINNKCALKKIKHTIQFNYGGSNLSPFSKASTKRKRESLGIVLCN